MDEFSLIFQWFRLVVDVKIRLVWSCEAYFVRNLPPLAVPRILYMFFGTMQWLFYLSGLFAARFGDLGVLFAGLLDK